MILSRTRRPESKIAAAAVQKFRPASCAPGSVTAAAGMSFAVSVSAAGMSFAVSVSAAGMSFAVVMMMAAEIRIGRQCAVQVGGDRRSDIAGDTSHQPDSGLGQRHLSAAADAAADQQIDPEIGEETGQCTVSGAVDRGELRVDDPAVFNVEHGKFRSVSEMLKYLTVGIAGYSDFHDDISFQVV